MQDGRKFRVSTLDGGRALFQTRPDILIHQGSRVVHDIDTKWKRISARIDDPKQGVSEADVYQMMAYAQLYDAPRLMLLYARHPGLGGQDMVHGRYSITGHATILETASIDVAKSTEILRRLRRLILSEIPWALELEV